MGKIIVCNTKTAQNPYTFLNTKVSVYSYEELCYYLYNNMVLVGEEDVTDRKSTRLNSSHVSESRMTSSA